MPMADQVARQLPDRSPDGAPADGLRRARRWRSRRSVCTASPPTACAPHAEIGVRMALGAGPRWIMKTVLRGPLLQTSSAWRSGCRSPYSRASHCGTSLRNRRAVLGAGRGALCWSGAPSPGDLPARRARPSIRRRRCDRSGTRHSALGIRHCRQWRVPSAGGRVPTSAGTRWRAEPGRTRQAFLLRWHIDRATRRRCRSAC